MEQQRRAAEARKWEPMRLSYVSSVGELMRNGTLGSRLDNSGGGSCNTSNRRTGGTGNLC